MSKDTLKLRPIQSDDITLFAKWWRDDYLRSVTSGDNHPLSDNELNQYFSAMINSQNDHHFMILADSMLIGHISLNERQNGWYETQIIIGNERDRGKGYGSAAIKQLLDFAQHKQIKQIYLAVRPDNKRAIAAYQKCGFQPTSVITLTNNPDLPHVLRMERNI